jgi:cytochrome c-type biogenesis protein CcsB
MPIVVITLAVAAVLITALLGSGRKGPLVSEENLLFATLVFYAASSALYLVFGVTAREVYERGASAAMAVGFLLNTGAFLHRWVAAGHPPFSNIYEMLLSFVWTLAALTLLAEWKYSLRVLGTITMPLAVVSVVLMQVLPSTVRPLVPALQSTWLHVHVSLAMLGYAACALSFALALMFLIQDHMRTESFLAWISLLVTGAYAGMLTRFHGGGLQVVAWEVEDGKGHEVFLTDTVRLMVVIPELGWLFALVLAAVAAPFLLYLGSRLLRDQRLLQWANYVFYISLLMQAAATAIFLSKAGGTYPSAQVEGAFATSLSASPFILTGMVGGIFASLLYLMLCWRREALQRVLPQPGRLDRLTYKSIGIAFPLLTLMIATGAYWANRTWGTYWSWDPKETWAAITWLVYAGYLHMRLTRGWRGRRAAYFAILGFAVVMFTFFGVTYLLPGLHSYS